MVNVTITQACTQYSDDCVILHLAVYEADFMTSNKKLIERFCGHMKQQYVYTKRNGTNILSIGHRIDIVYVYALYQIHTTWYAYKLNGSDFKSFKLQNIYFPHLPVWLYFIEGYLDYIWLSTHPTHGIQVEANCYAVLLMVKFTCYSSS